jgi:hypothetical protein
LCLTVAEMRGSKDASNSGVFRRWRARRAAAPIGGPNAARKSGRTSVRDVASIFCCLCELRHIALPRIDLLCISSLTWTRQQWRVSFLGSAVWANLRGDPIHFKRPAAQHQPATQTLTSGLPSVVDG